MVADPNLDNKPIPERKLYRLYEFDDADAALIGGKAWGLVQLEHAGLPVPRALALVPGDGPPQLDPDAVVAELGRGPYFVRSSFSIEDQAGQSFAGQGLTIGHLDRAELPDAVQRVWESWNSEHAASYRASHDLDDRRAGSIVIQKEVIPVWSGVLFTRSPGAIGDWARLEAGKGYGESVVAGLIEPVAVEFHHRRSSFLGAPPPDLVGALSRFRKLLPDLERIASGPADVEWAIDSRGQVAILQVRPTTGEARRIWSSALGDEFWSGEVSRMMYSTVGRQIESVMLREPLSVVGVAPDEPLLRRHEGRIYVNVTALAEALNVVPGWAVTRTLLDIFAPEIRQRFEQESEAGRPVIPMAFFKAGARFIVRGFPWFPFLQPLALPFLRRNADHWRDRTVPRDRAALVGEIDQCLADLGRMLRWVTWGMMYAYLAAPLLDRLLGTRVGAAGAGSLFRNLPFDPVRELDDELKSFASRHRDHVNAADYNGFRDAMPLPVLQNYDKLVEKWQHRAEERDLRGIRWGENPAAPWALMKIASDQVEPDYEHWLVWIFRSFRPYRNPVAIPRWLSVTAIAAMARLYLGFRERMRDLADRYLLALRRRVAALSELDQIDNPWSQSWVPGSGMAVADVPGDDTATGQPVPDFLINDSPVWEAVPEHVSGLLVGTGVSNGVSEGKAVWVDSLKDLDNFSPGDILVASYLDPSLSIALEAASAAVFEFGGMLSHGAIIAREYGVPAVVGIHGLRQRVQDGDQLQVDGGTGRIHLLVAPD